MAASDAQLAQLQEDSSLVITGQHSPSFPVCLCVCVCVCVCHKPLSSTSGQNLSSQHACAMR